MKKFRKRIRIENAEAFKLEYFDGRGLKKEKEFTTYKSLEQFHSRQRDFLYLELSRYAFVNNKWHRFLKLSSLFVFATEVDSITKFFKEKIDAENLQDIKSEDK